MNTNKYLKLLYNLFDHILVFLRIIIREIFSVSNAKKLLSIREHSIVSLKEYTELIDVLGSEEEIAIESLFMGFSAESIKANRVTLYIYDSSKNILYPNAIMMYKDGKLLPYDYYTELKDITIKLGEDISGIAAQTKEPIFIETVSQDKRYKGKVDKKIKMKTNSIIAIPLIIDGKLFGTIEIANNVDNRNLSIIDFYTTSIITKLTMTAMEKAKMYTWAITDNLTQLYNYHYLQISLEQELTRAKRYPQDVGVMLLDIDNFKKINDTYGHPMGNTVLKSISEIMLTSIRKNIDMPVRYGGDEFLIILPETDIKGTKILAQRILKQIQETPYNSGEKRFNVTVSIGVTAAHKNDIVDKDKLIKKADTALYEAKKRGKNRIITKS